MEMMMNMLLLLIPVAAYFAYRSRLACLLRSLPDTNEDFALF
jgi:hypothetical protein